MAKSKKHREESSSDSDESTETDSSSSSDSSSSESSSSEEEIKKKRRLKKTKSTKSKKRRKKSSSSSSSSSSSDSEDDTSSSSSSEDEKPKKKKVAKEKNLKSKKETPADIEKSKMHEKHVKRSEHKVVRVENDDQRRELREVSDTHNRSKWDSPNNEFEENRRERHKNRDREYHEDYNRNNEDKRGRRYEDNKDERYSNRREDFRERLDRDRERRRDREQEYVDWNRNRNRDRDHKPYRFRDNNYNERRYNNRENRDWNRDRDRREDRENRRSRSRSPRRPRNFPRRRSRDDNKPYEWGKKEDGEKSSKPPEEKDKPNFGLSGKLTEDTNKVNGVVIKYAEPPEARKPKRRWRLYPFKGEKALPTLYIHRQSCYLIGRDRKVCDLPVDHPSCSKQHAALQYRLVPFEREDGTVGKRVRPYLIDLESANGTFINNKKIDSKKYIELLEKDVIKFGFSSREYVLLHENSKEDQQDDDITEEVQVKEEPTETESAELAD